MKFKLLIFTAIAIMIAKNTTYAQIEHIEPPFWWTGMKHTRLQVMVHGKNIADSRVNIDYDGLQLVSVDRTASKNYLFVNLDISPETKPGSFMIKFTDEHNKTIEKEYKLLERKPGSAERKGFDNSDVMYLIMPDRFANGDPSNDEIEGMKEGLNRRKRYGRHGGDIKGIRDHLDYIADMGFTAIWLNPVLENDMEEWSYHGYAATDFYKVDRRFGTNEDYVEMIREAKEKGMKVIMDMIFNHCGSGHWWMDDLPADDWLSYPEYVRTNHRRTVNQDLYASEADKEKMTRGWFSASMPDMNQRNPFMTEYLIQNSIWWIEYAGLAGIRMDTYPYPDKHMMAEWNRRISAEYPFFNIVGEEWSLEPAIVSYWQKGQDNKDGYQGELPSLMDFPLQNAVSEGLKEKEEWNTGLIKIYEMLAGDFLYPNPYNLVIFPDNHDMPRFYMQLDMNKDMFRNGIVFFLTTRGIPQIFYGTEILMTHKEGDDHGYIRKDFPGGWAGDKVNAFTGQGLDSEEKNMQSMFKKLLNWRKTAGVIHTGKLMHFAPEHNTYVYFRYNDNDMVMVIINKNASPYDLHLERFGEMLEGKKSGKDVLGGRVYDLDETIKLSPRKPYILEIQ
ncbi:MAG: glycoside hydrolase family 13 protein [Bacteroidales bacterium]|nr:glycoside hydrolase family 13 protein [Bacteroidales bacterium]